MNEPLETIEELISALDAKPSLPLVFDFGDGKLERGFHITELRSARISAVDCGGRQDAWDETVIEVMGGYGAPMAAHKCAAILRRSLGLIPTLAHGRLIVAGAPGTGPARRASARVRTDEAEAVVLDLTAESAACKPAQEYERATGRRCC